jgi:hypothetical protein
MGDRWMDEREGRGRDWRSDAYGRGEGRSPEGRSFEDQSYGARRGGSDRDRVFGERDTGAEYNRSGVTGGGGMRFESQDYTRGGRFYGDDARSPIYRSEYGQGGRQYGRVPEGYDAGRPSRAAYDNADLERGYRRDLRQRASGGTGGYDYERGYGDGGREAGGHRGGWQDRDYSGPSPAFYTHGPEADLRFGGRGERFEARAYQAGQGLRRVGERISNFLGGLDFGDGLTDHRGRGPKNFKRSDDRIHEDVCQRLTDDPWLDASEIEVGVSAGEVTLSGSVESREAKRRAEDLAEDRTGVTNVRNDLRVAERRS